jgi:hypothetical protein
MKNIHHWLPTLLGLVAALCMTSSEHYLLVQATDAKSLFNGTDLEGWDGDPRFWRVQNGELIGETTETVKAEKNTFLIYRGGEFGDIDLQFKYQVTGQNSGIQYRSKELGKWSIGGYQSDFEAQHHKSGEAKIDKFSGMFFEEQGRMFMAQRGQSVIVRNNPDNAKKPKIEVIGSVGSNEQLEKLIHRDGWNEMRVIARGFTFVHIINGQVMSSAIDEDVPNRTAKGLIAFQLHSGAPMKIQVKELTVRELK